MSEDLRRSIRSLTIVGGASGVGKTTVISSLPSSLLEILSTGTYFKEYMSLASRDDVRSVNWTDFEAQVTDALIRDLVAATLSGKRVIIDTHFAAKVAGKSYRIGLAQEQIFRLARAFFEAAEGRPDRTAVALITVDPHELLRRRHADSSRRRELLPSDCVIGLRDNDIYALRYVSELKRAAQSHDKQHEAAAPRVEFHHIPNDDLATATRRLHHAVFGSAETLGKQE